MKKVSRKSMIAFLVLTVFGLTLSKGLLYGININVNAEAEEDTAVPEYLHFTVGENNTPERYYAILKSCDTDYKGIVTIPDKVDGKNVKVIAQSAFMNCTGIENVVIPSSVDLIGKGAFYGCTGLKEITIPNGVGWIESRVFENCTGLTSISIPESVVLFGDDVFKGCSNLQTIDIPDKFKEKVIDIISKNATSLLNEINQSKSEKYTVDVKQMGFTAQGDNR